MSYVLPLNLKPGFHKMFQWSQQIGVVCSRECCCVLPVSISNHRLVYCQVFCIWRHVNRVAHLDNDFPKFVIFSCSQRCSFFSSKDRKSFLRPALSVSIDHNHSISRHKLRKTSTCVTLLRARRLLLLRLELLKSISVHKSEDIERRCASC